MTARQRQLHLGAFYATGQHHTAWTLDGATDDETLFDNYAHVAKLAEEAHFDFFFLDNGLGLRRQIDGLVETDIAVRPEMITIMSAIAAATDRIGVISTLNTSYHNPYQLVREVSSLQYLSGGRLGWNVVTGGSPDVTANFRRSASVNPGENYDRAQDFVRYSRRLWSQSWRRGDGTDADWIQDEVAYEGPFFSAVGPAGVAPSPAGDPVVFQAGHSDKGREVAASFADGIYTMQWDLEEAQDFYRDVKRRLPAYGRIEDDLKIMSGLSAIVAPSREEAEARHREYLNAVFHQRTLERLVEQVWGTTFEGYDFDGPFPDFEPDPARARISTKVGPYGLKDPIKAAAFLRERARTEGLSARDALIKSNARNFFLGTATEIADQIQQWFESKAVDGFILETHYLPGGLDDFAREVVPELVARGIFRSGYGEGGLRERLGLHPERSLPPQSLARQPPAQPTTST